VSDYTSKRNSAHDGKKKRGNITRNSADGNRSNGGTGKRNFVPSQALEAQKTVAMHSQMEVPGICDQRHHNNAGMTI
jgi:hypothetical protein